MSDTLNNPFDMTQQGGNQPGLLGQTPDFWRSIALFGGNMAAGANARTAGGFLANGTGLAGPVGAAVGQTMQQTGQGAALRSNIASQGAETQGKQISNIGAMSGLPLTVARNQMLTRAYTDPDYMRQLMGMFGGGGMPASGQGAPQPSAGPSTYASAVNAGEGTGANPRSSASGSGQFINGVWQQFAQENPQYFQGMTPDQIMAARNDPGLGAKATDWLATKNAPALQSAGVQPNGATLAMAHFLGPQAAAAVIKAPDDAVAGGVIGAALGADKGAQYIQANPSLATTTAGALKARYAGVPDPPFIGGGQPQQAGQPGQISGQEALAKAQQLENQANMLEMAKGMGLPLSGDPAAIRAAAQQWRAVGLAGPTAQIKSDVALNQARQMPYDLRAGGMHIDPVTGTDVKNPELREMTAPDGSKYYAHINPPSPSAPPGTAGSMSPVVGPDGQTATAALPPNLQAARTKSYDDFAGKDTDSYIASQNTHGWLEQMNHAADTANANGGFLTTGPTAPERVAFAANVNDVLRTAGFPAVFDPTKVGVFEELKKATSTAGFELASHYEGHARQAAQTIMNATSAVPAETNSPVGYRMVSAGIQEAAQQAIDAHEFKQGVYNQSGDLNKAEVDFYKANPAQMYARRAISTVTPYDIKTDAELGRFLPGTFVKYKGNLVQVPARDGAPAIPDYLKGPQPQTAQTAQQ